MKPMPADKDNWQDISVSVSEVYDKLTVQGEGPSVGRPCTFVRFGLCNLACQWCDSAYTWNGTESFERMTVGRVLDRVVDAPRLVITGGEPLVQARATLALAALAVWEREMFVEIETNGTMLPHPEWPDHVPVQWNVSPKLAHSGVPAIFALNYEALGWFAEHGAHFKFVCQTADDVDEAAGVLLGLYTQGHPVNAEQVWIMPEGVTSGRVRETGQAIAERALFHGFNITPRLHIDLWGQERGR